MQILSFKMDRKGTYDSNVMMTDYLEKDQAIVCKNIVFDFYLLNKGNWKTKRMWIGKAQEECSIIRS